MQDKQILKTKEMAQTADRHQYQQHPTQNVESDLLVQPFKIQSAETYLTQSQKTMTQPSISNHQKTKFKYAAIADRSRSIQEKLKNLRMQKSSTIQRLNKIYEQQKITVSLRKSSLLKNKSMERSQNSPLSDKIVRKIMLDEKRRSLLQQHQTKKLLKQIEEENLRKMKESELMLNEKRLLKRKELVQKKKRLIEAVNIKTQQKYQNKYLKMTEEDYIYAKNKKTDDIRRLQDRKKSQQILEANKKRFITDFKEIQNYAKEHDKLLKVKQSMRKNSVRASLDIGKMKKYQKCTFQAMVEEENFRRMIEEEDKIRRKKQNRKKVDEFKAYIKQQFKPKSSSKSVFHPKLSLRRTEMSKQTITQMGNSNLTQSKRITRKRNRTESTFIQIPIQKSIPKYKNYLESLKHNSQRKPVNPEQELKKLSSLQQLSPKQAQKALKLGSTIENRYRAKLKNMEDEDFYLANTKIRCLESIYKTVSHS